MAHCVSRLETKINFRTQKRYTKNSSNKIQHHSTEFRWKGTKKNFFLPFLSSTFDGKFVVFPLCFDVAFYALIGFSNLRFLTLSFNKGLWESSSQFMISMGVFSDRKISELNLLNSLCHIEISGKRNQNTFLTRQ